MNSARQQGKWFWLIFTTVILVTTLLASPVTAGHGGMGGGGGGGGGGDVIDPPVGGLFHDLVLMPDLDPLSNVFEGNLEAKIAAVNINGVTANLMTYNGLYPGPLIKVKREDILKLNFTNSLPATTARNILGFEKNHTNIHTHGLHVSPEEPADAAHLDLLPGQTYHYEYDLSMQAGGTLNFIHGHVHGLTAEQYWGGMLGIIIVEDEIPVLSSFETHTMVLKDITLSGTEPEPYTSGMDFMHGKEGNIITVNGVVNPQLNTRPGQVQRWRIINGSNARFYNLQLQGHTMYLVGTDGGLLDKPYAVSNILLSPGERIDVLVKASRTSGNYKLLSLPYSRQGNMAGAQITLLTVADKGSRVDQSIPASIDPNATRLNIDTGMLPKRTLTLTMMMGRGYINGLDYDVEPYIIMSEVGTYEVWEIINNSGMDHPFHQHVNAAQVLSITGGDAGYASLYTTIPALKDVVLVPKWGSVKILVPVMDYTGMTMFHCHIVEHEDIGMMGMWHIMGNMP